MFRAMAKEQDNKDKAQYLFLKSITLVSLYTWPMFLAAGWLALPVIRFLYGEKWVEAAPAMTWLAVIGPFTMLEMLAGAVLAALNWLKREIPVQIVQLSITALGAIAGVPYGLVGITIGASIGVVYGAFHLSWLALRCLELNPIQLFKAMAPAALITLVLALVMSAFEYLVDFSGLGNDLLHLVSMGLVGFSVYAVLFYYIPNKSLVEEKMKWKNKLFRKG
jgi:O-antigen/teichoic acid export membrane protein